MYHKRMTTEANTSIVSYSYHFYFVVRTFRIDSLSDIQVHSSTVLLTTATTLCKRSPELTHLPTGSPTL